MNYLYRKREVLENSHPQNPSLKRQHKDSSLYTPRNDSAYELLIDLEHQDFELFFLHLHARLFSVVNATRLRDLQVG